MNKYLPIALIVVGLGVMAGATGYYYATKERTFELLGVEITESQLKENLDKAAEGINEWAAKLEAENAEREAEDKARAEAKCDNWKKYLEMYEAVSPAITACTIKIQMGGNMQSKSCRTVTKGLNNMDPVYELARAEVKASKYCMSNMDAVRFDLAEKGLKRLTSAVNLYLK